MELTVILNGKGFKPSLLNGILPSITILSEAGEITPSGRYKGEVSPYGMCFYDTEIESTSDVEREIEKLKNLQLNNVTDIEFEISELNYNRYEPWCD